MPALKDILILGSATNQHIFEDRRYDMYRIHSINWKNEEELEKVVEKDNLACVVFTGGADVHPMWYGESREDHTWPDLPRDIIEKEFFSYCLEKGIPMIGICRGAQLFNVMLGGKMVQDISGHYGSHLIVTEDGREIPVNSIHHQAMIPSDKLKVVAKSVIDDIPEVVVNEELSILGVQFHPELLSYNHAGFIYFQSLIEKYDIV